jgi:hypothetical protein
MSEQRKRLIVVSLSLAAISEQSAREGVILQVRYRVAQQGWHRVAESTVDYCVG